MSPNIRTVRSPPCRHSRDAYDVGGTRAMPICIASSFQPSAASLICTLMSLVARLCCNVPAARASMLSFRSQGCKLHGCGAAFTIALAAFSLCWGSTCAVIALQPICQCLHVLLTYDRCLMLTFSCMVCLQVCHAIYGTICGLASSRAKHAVLQAVKVECWRLQ